MIENRNLSVGTRLVATYKKQAYVCTVEATPDGDAHQYTLANGRSFKSPSAAGSVIMGGKAVNGWRFWSLETEAPVAITQPGKTKATKEKTARTIRRVPNQQGVPEGQVRMHCSACQKGFITDAGAEPVCPEGHSNNEAAAS